MTAMVFGALSTGCAIQPPATVNPASGLVGAQALQTSNNAAPVRMHVMDYGYGYYGTGGKSMKHSTKKKSHKSTRKSTKRHSKKTGGYRPYY